MAGAGKNFHFLLVLFIGFSLLFFSVMCNDEEELNQELIEDNLTISYNHTFTYLTASFGGPLVKGIEFHVSVASPNRYTKNIALYFLLQLMHIIFLMCYVIHLLQESLLWTYRSSSHQRQSDSSILDCCDSAIRYIASMHFFFCWLIKIYPFTAKICFYFICRLPVCSESSKCPSK